MISTPGSVLSVGIAVVGLDVGLDDGLDDGLVLVGTWDGLVVVGLDDGLLALLVLGAFDDVGVVEGTTDGIDMVDVGLEDGLQ